MSPLVTLYVSNDYYQGPTLAAVITYNNYVYFLSNFTIIICVCGSYLHVLNTIVYIYNIIIV